MKQLRFFGFLISLLLITTAASAKDISGLCMRAGLTGQEMERIKVAYLEAVESGIDEGELYAFFEVILNHGLNCSQLVTVLNKSTRLKSGGLPFWPLFSKVREGITKGVPPGKIVQVVDARTNSLSRADEVTSSLRSKGYVIKDYNGAVILISSFIEKGYSSEVIVGRIDQKGIENSGFSGLSEVVGQGQN
jgi:hypothetical protein